MWDKVLSILGGNLFTGVTDLVKAFKLPPEQQIAFEQAMAQMQAELKTSLAKIDADDRNSARQREMAVKDTTPRVLAFVTVGGFLGSALWLIMMPYVLPPVEFTQFQAGLIGTVIGYLSAKSELALAYYFGSSSGSQAKDVTIDKLSAGKDK